MVAVWQSEEAQRHEPCGTYKWEWEENPGAYVAEVDDCPACDLVTDKKKQVIEEHRPELIQGWHIVLVPERFADGE